MLRRNKIIVGGGAIVVVVVMLLVVLSLVVIHSQTVDECVKAQSVYEGDCVRALLTALEDESVPVGEKNSVVWTLGQLADDRAIVKLEVMQNELGQQERCERGVEICRREVDKALKWCKQGNITSWMYGKRVRGIKKQ